jgi:hypothetical protein
MDAHTVYPSDYIPQLLRWLAESGADNVGGVCRTLPGSDTAIAQAIAVALSHPLGVGNSYFRIGTTEPRWVDTVPFGCYRREVFSRVGFFDEELVRNQDDEFNHRLVAAGGRVLLVPEIVSSYRARTTLRQLWRMYYQYGYFKPLVVRKLGRIPTVRQLVPSLFVLGMLGMAVLAAWFPAASIALLLIGSTYLAVLLGAAVRAPIHPRSRAALPTAFAALHLAYGTGYLHGVLDFFLRSRRRVRDPASIPLSR